MNAGQAPARPTRRLVVLAIVLAAGCVAPAAERSSPPVDDAIPSLALDHDHEDPALHSYVAAMSLAAYLPACESSSPCSFAEIDVWGDLAIQTIIEPYGGFALIDVAEPRAPRLLSRTGLGATFVTDVKLAPDGRTAFVAVSTYLPFAGMEGVRKEPTSAAGVARSQGIFVYDLTDPAMPVERSYFPLGADGVHMMDVHMIEGGMYVFATVPVYFKFLLPGVVREPVERITILRFDGQGLARVADYAPPEAVPGDSAHDVTIVDDPVEGPLMLAPFRFGIAVASVADPAKSAHLGSWKLADAGFDADRNTHTVMMTFVEGRRTLIVTPEQLEDNELFVIDAEDLGAMDLVGTWHLPGELGDYKGLHWSLHNVNVLDGKAYVAHYHGGVWVLDINTTGALAAPPVLGHFATVERGNVGPGLADLWAGPTAPNVWDVVPGKGVVFVSDITSGFYVLDGDWAIPDGSPFGTRGA